MGESSKKKVPWRPTNDALSRELKFRALDGTNTASATSSAVTRGHAERILLVDDEESILRVTEHMLHRIGGYTVVTARDGMEALERFEAEHFDLVISDQTMPRMLGHQLAREIHQRKPETPIIISSGFSGLVMKKAVGAPGVSAVLQKPFTIEELGEVVAGALRVKERQ